MQAFSKKKKQTNRRRQKTDTTGRRRSKEASKEEEQEEHKENHRAKHPSEEADLGSQCGREEAWIRVRVRVWRSWRCSCLSVCYIASLCFVSCDWQKRRRDSMGVTLCWVREF
jgi:hypothetical protein